MPEPDKRLKIGVVILNWNGGEFTIPCIRSLKEGSRKPDIIVVVDNASTDGSPDRIATEFSEVCLIRNAQNMGFTGGCNIGIKWLLDRDVDLLWVLNNDTVVARECLSSLAAEMEHSSGVAVVSGKIMDDPCRDRIWYAGGELTDVSLTARHFGQGKIDAGRYDSKRDVTFVSGCCMLVRRRIWGEVGLFDERFFAYYEDVEWCLRARRHNLSMRYVPSALVWHRGGCGTRKEVGPDGGGTVSALVHYFQARNRLLMIRIHADGRLMVWGVALGSYVLHNLYIIAGHLILGRTRKLSHVLKGIGDGVRMDLQVRNKQESRT